MPSRVSQITVERRSGKRYRAADADVMQWSNMVLLPLIGTLRPLQLCSLPEAPLK